MGGRQLIGPQINFVQWTVDQEIWCFVNDKENMLFEYIRSKRYAFYTQKKQQFPVTIYKVPY